MEELTKLIGELISGTLEETVLQNGQPVSTPHGDDDRLIEQTRMEIIFKTSQAAQTLNDDHKRLCTQPSSMAKRCLHDWPEKNHRHIAKSVVKSGVNTEVPLTRLSRFRKPVATASEEVF